MALHKFENQIKEKLNTREIQPTTQAWDRLDAMLSVAEEKKTRRPLGFLFIAASILVFVTLGLFFFTQENNNIEPLNNVVTTEEQDSIKKSISPLATPIKEQKQVVVSNEPATSNQQSVIHQFQSSKEVHPNRLERFNKNQQQETRQNQSNNPNIIRDKPIEFQNTSVIALKDLPKVVSGNPVILSKGAIPSDDQLVADLDKTVKQSTSKSTAVKVDAKSLLSEVDGELELSFREKVIQKVSKNYQEVKVALSNRNNQ